MRGVEANLTNAKGALDLPPEALLRLDYALVGFHENCGLKPGTTAKNTKALIAALQNPRVKVLAHPGNPAFPVEPVPLVEAACALGVAVEINNLSFGRSRKGSFDACSRLASLVAEARGLICLSSDAHVACQVGEVSDAWAVASRAGVRPEQVVNRTYESLVAFLELGEELDEGRP